MNILEKFENLVVLKTIMDFKDLNYLDTVDLQQVADCAEELDIDLNAIDMDNIKDSEYDRIYDIFMEWFEDVNYMYNDVKEELLKEVFN